MRAKIVKHLNERDKDNHAQIKFLVEVGDGEFDEIIAYNELSDLIERQHEAEAKGEMNVWTFKDIVSHQGPLKPNDNVTRVCRSTFLFSGKMVVKCMSRSQRS